MGFLKVEKVFIWSFNSCSIFSDGFGASWGSGVWEIRDLRNFLFNWI